MLSAMRSSLLTFCSNAMVSLASTVSYWVTSIVANEPQLYNYLSQLTVKSLGFYSLTGSEVISVLKVVNIQRLTLETALHTFISNKDCLITS